MKAAVITVRIVLGALFLFSSVAYFLNLIPPGEMSQGAQAFFTGMVASKYLLPVVKVIELLVGIALLTGKFVPLATVVIFPITINIVLFHAFLAPEGMIVPIVILLGNLFLAYRYRENYQSLVAA